MHQWQAHDAPIVKVCPYDQRHVLTVALDRTAVLWDVSGRMPQQSGVVRGLPEAQGGMTLGSVMLHTYNWNSGGSRGGSQSILFAMSGHKIAGAVVTPGMGDNKIKAGNFVDTQGQKVRVVVVGEQCFYFLFLEPD